MIYGVEDSGFTSDLHSILLQKSFGGDERNFLGPLMRFVRRDVRDLIAHQKNGHEASYRRHRALQRWSRAKFGFREIFSVVLSKTILTALKRYFRSTSNNGHRQTGTVGLFSGIHVLRVNYQDVQLAFGRGQSRMRLFRLCGFTSITPACRPY
jgi:hypothetical protein